MASQPQDSSSEERKPAATEKILVPEVNALKSILKDTLIKTGQVLSFHAETRKLGIEVHARNPPRSLTAALGRDLEKYDQLCDSIEAHILRAISVLKRDLRREEERNAAEERRKQTEALMLPPPVPVAIQNSEVTPDTPLTQPSTEEGGTNPRNSPVLTGRRPSAISISSLHRPQFPLKLDLSSTSMRITEEEAAMFPKGLASPVTLAPKSARPTGPNDFPPDFLAALGNDPTQLDVPHSNIDLTLSGGMEQKSDLTALGVGLGDSSDKPIELDLDAMDIDLANMSQFGAHIEGDEVGDSHDGLFSPMLDDLEGDGENNSQRQKDDENPLSTFDMDSGVNDELFGDFTSNSGLEETLATEASMAQPHTLGSGVVPFSTDQNLLDDKIPSSSNGMLAETGESFDLNSLDLSNLASEFYSGSQDNEMNFAMDMDMASFLNMESAPESKPDGDINKTQSLPQA